jgi:hypothetical protein
VNWDETQDTDRTQLKDTSRPHQLCTFHYRQTLAKSPGACLSSMDITFGNLICGH